MGTTVDGQLDRLSAIVDVNTPSAARMYDYYLGGSHNFTADRETADAVAQAIPWVKDVAVANRAFLRRAVRFCVAQGIRQFIDIGSGTPTVGNVHEIAQQADPSCRVVYVDNEPVAVAHSELLLEDEPQAAIVQADARDPEAILSAPETAALIDFEQPVAVMMVALLHFIPDTSDPLGIIGKFRDVMAPGSFFGMSHVTQDSYAEPLQKLVELYRKSTNPVTARTRAEITGLFTGFDLVEPGLVWTEEWQPEHPDLVSADPSASLVYAGVGRKS